jgi:hypothetical protein
VTISRFVSRFAIGTMGVCLIYGCTVDEALDRRTKVNEYPTGENSRLSLLEQGTPEPTSDGPPENMYCCVRLKGSMRIELSLPVENPRDCGLLSTIYPRDQYNINAVNGFCDPGEPVPETDGTTETCCYYNANRFLLGQSHGSNCQRLSPPGTQQTEWTVGIIRCPLTLEGPTPYASIQYLVVPGGCGAYKVDDEIAISDRRCLINSVSPDEDGCMIEARCQ